MHGFVEEEMEVAWWVYFPGYRQEEEGKEESGRRLEFKGCVVIRRQCRQL
jgi:hypothetical protein